jgi:hypothetical protein
VDAPNLSSASAKVKALRRPPSAGLVASHRPPPVPADAEGEGAAASDLMTAIPRVHVSRREKGASKWRGGVVWRHHVT